jgi:hypothetical protein
MELAQRQQKSGWIINHNLKTKANKKALHLFFV